MAGNLTDAAENGILDHICGEAAYTVTGPMKLALTTDAPTDAAAGTEVVGGSYARPTLSFSAAASGAITNDTLVSISAMPATTVTGWNIYSSDGTPKRIWYGTFSVAKTVNAGDTFEVAIGDIDLTIS